MKGCSKLKMPIPESIALNRTVIIKTQLIGCFISIRMQFMLLKIKRQANCLAPPFFTKACFRLMTLRTSTVGKRTPNRRDELPIIAGGPQR
jgi:hypothetical protein